MEKKILAISFGGFDVIGINDCGHKYRLLSGIYNSIFQAFLKPIWLFHFVKILWNIFISIE